MRGFRGVAGKGKSKSKSSRRSDWYDEGDDWNRGGYESRGASWDYEWEPPSWSKGKSKSRGKGKGRRGGDKNLFSI